MIHCIGDSHVSLFSGKKEMIDSYPNVITNGQFRCYRLGALTATGIEQHSGRIYKILNKFVDKENDDVLLSFGEIDIRAHLSKLIFTKGKDFKEVGPSVDEYFKFILKVCQKGYKVSILGVPPSHNTSQNYDVSFGTNLERNYISRIWNNYLQSLCDKYKIPFPCVFDEILNSDGSTKIEYMDGWVHLNQKCWPYMLEELKINNILCE